MIEDLKTMSLPSRYGLVTVPADDVVIGLSLATYGEWAQQEIDTLLHFIKAGDTVLDIGACFGTHSLAFSERVGQSGRVVAFEASPKNFPLLQKNCRACRAGTIELIQAVVAKDDTVDFLLRNDEENSGASSFEAADSVRPLAGGTKIAIQSRSIDSFNFNRVDFIKIDVEGMESVVVEGALATLQRCAPYIFFEVNFIEEGRKTIELLRGRDYLFFGVLCEAFNPDNFYGATERIFGNGRECGVLAVPRTRYGEVDEIILAHQLATIETADDLALLLMNKPQYVGADITRERAARTLKVPAIVASVGGVDDLVRELAVFRDSKTGIEREVAILNDRNRDLDAELHRLRAEMLARDGEFEALNKLNRALENELSLLHEGKDSIEQDFVKLKYDYSNLEKEFLSVREEQSDLELEFASLSALQKNMEHELQRSRDEKLSSQNECGILKSSITSLESDLHQLHNWKEALERKLAALDKQGRSSQEALEASQEALIASSEALDAAQNERERQEREIERLGALLKMAKTLARRVGKFPFALFFRRKRKYESILVSLQSAPVPGEPGTPPNVREI